MQHWIDRSGIAGRPKPKLGETAEERAARQREALAWGLNSGAAGESELTAFNAAADAALAHDRPLDRVNDTARALIDRSKKAMQN